MAGFLAASASFSQDHAYARLYLAPQWARTWNPGWAVTVVSGQPAPQAAAAQVHQQAGQ